MHCISFWFVNITSKTKTKNSCSLPQTVTGSPFSSEILIPNVTSEELQPLQLSGPFSSHLLQHSSKWVHEELEQKREERNDLEVELPFEKWGERDRQACKKREGGRWTEGPYLTWQVCWPGGGMVWAGA